jgi:hypothetical protein
MSNTIFRQRHEVVGSSNRSFGLVFTAAFSLIGLWPLLHDQPPRIWMLGLSGAFLATTLVWPTALGSLNRWWTRLGMLLHSIFSPIALGVLFYGVVTPTGIIMRLTSHHDPLRLKFDSEVESYWIERVPPGSSPSSMINQF